MRKAYCRLSFGDVGFESILGGFAGTYYPFVGYVCVLLWLYTGSSMTSLPSYISFFVPNQYHMLVSLLISSAERHINFPSRDRT